MFCTIFPKLVARKIFCSCLRIGEELQIRSHQFKQCFWVSNLTSQTLTHIPVIWLFYFDFTYIERIETVVSSISVVMNCLECNCATCLWQKLKFIWIACYFLLCVISNKISQQTFLFISHGCAWTFSAEVSKPFPLDSSLLCK